MDEGWGADLGVGVVVLRCGVRVLARMLERTALPFTGEEIHDTVRDMTDAERRQRLKEWLDLIYKDVQDVIVDNHMFWEVQEILKKNPSLANMPNLFNQWMASNFIQSAAVGVRRQADRGADCVSLHRFLTEIAEHPSLVSREYYVSLYDGVNLPKNFATEFANHNYDELVGAGKSQPDVADIRSEIDTLQAQTDGIRHYVNKRTAHYDMRGLQKPIPTFDDLSACLSLFEKLIKKYHNLLTGAALTSLLPTFLDDWQAVFRSAWIEDSNE